MTHSPVAPNSGFLVRSGQPLIGVLVEEDGEEMVRYFSEEQEADTVASLSVTQDALRLAGAWSDLDWEEWVEDEIVFVTNVAFAASCIMRRYLWIAPHLRLIFTVENQRFP